jgi:integrase
MGRLTNDAPLSSAAGRAKLMPRGKPYFRALEPGLHLGYRRTRGKPGTWMARYYCGDQRYKVEAITHLTPYGTAPCIADDASPADGVRVLSYSQAIERARARASERANEGAGIAKPATVATALDAYLRDQTPETRGRANLHIRPALGNVELESLATDQLRDWLAALANAPARTRNGEATHNGGDEAVRKRKASANRTWTILKAALNHAYKDGKVSSDRTWRRVEPFRDVERARERFLTLDEAQRLIAACSDEFRPLVQAALQTGARYGALQKLRVEDFEVTGGTLHVRENRKGKRNRPYDVTLTEEGVAFFAELCAGRAGHEFMLTRANGQPWRRSNQQVRMDAACRKAGIVPPINFHALRHTWPSLAVMNGTPLMVVAKNLGHSDTTMVEKHYARLAPNFITDAIRAGAPRFGGAS